MGPEKDTSADAFIAALRLMQGTELEEAIAKEAEVTLQDAIQATLVAGETPEGKPWAPKRRGGGRPYANASSTLKTVATGNYVRMTISGPDVFGHFGRTGKQVARPMLPDAGAGTPPVVSKALDLAAERAGAKAVGK
jgi:hypothetical protein